MERIAGYAPLVDDRSTTLILGTAPSAASLRAGFYYAHPRNAFWRILADVYGCAVPHTPDQKTALLLENRLALRDVARSCEREGSLDAAIRAPQPNDFSAFFARYAGIGRVLFNGATAENLYRRLIGKAPCETARMPSTSPAHTMPYSEKCAIWRKNMEDIL